MILTCTNHCGTCHRHFHSLEAFDLHKEHDETGWPHCLDPIDLEDRDGKPRLVELGRGECRMYAEVKRDVIIWTSARDLGGIQRRFGSSDVGRDALTPSGPNPDPGPKEAFK
jgi:hypothetical protein